MRKDDSGDKENRTDDHDVCGGEGWFTRAVGASCDHKDIVKDDIGECHKRDW